MRTLNINPEYLALVKRPNQTEYKSLELSIIEKQRAVEPIKINNKNEILDGHTRYDICSKHSLNFDTQVMVFSSVNEEKKYVIESNLLRRQLSIIDKVILLRSLEPIEAELALERKKAGVPCGKISTGKTRDIMGAKIGISGKTYDKIVAVLDCGKPELIKNVREGKTSPSYAYQSLNLHQKHANPPKLPIGEFDVIYADPPWKYDIALRGSPDTHYPIMETDVICELKNKLPISKDAVLFLWATNPKLQEGIRVMREWGFEYKTNMVWVKDKIGTGYYFRGAHELLLVGIRGNIPPPTEENRVSSVLNSPTEEHSVKPKAVYGMIEKMYPNRKCLELFARPQTRRANWAYWGDEMPLF